MDGDRNTNEILRAVGSLEGTVKSLVDRFDEHQIDLKEMKITCQRFEDYRESRKNLPERISSVEEIANDYQKSKKERDEKYTEISFLIGKYKFLLALAAAINLLGILLGFLFARGWLQWTL